MNWVVILRPLADADVRDAVADFDARTPGLGQRFLARLGEVLVRLETNPHLYGIVWRDVRAARLKRFKHVVYFVVLPPDRVEVIAVLHGHRSAAAWQGRA